MGIREVIDAATGATLFVSDVEQEVLSWFERSDTRRVFHWCEVGTAYTDMAVRDEFRELYRTRNMRGEIWVVPYLAVNLPTI